jgi:rubrerythrin
MAKLFQRKKEDFVCEVCGTSVKGNGYTNHCPQCLCSKHVDVNPGDRACGCGGIMRPVGLEIKAGRRRIIHQCQKCGFSRKNDVCKEDNAEVVIKLSAGEV